MKNKKSMMGITLVALVITIIVLLILAGVSIAMLAGENGILGNAEKTIGKSENAQIKENAILADYENKINIDGTRNGTGNASGIKSLINKNDGIYNATEGGYVFDISTTTNNYTTNNVITLTESIENYDAIMFDIDLYLNMPGSFTGYSYFSTQIVSKDQIKRKYNNTNELDREAAFFISSITAEGETHRLTTWFKDNKTMNVFLGYTSTSTYTKMRITDIKGIKY